jgi:UDP-GlcNAc:undecaprenyl-phosphate/decaprenyl-phosphate GlcNAc-1-phosphate transferase
MTPGSDLEVIIGRAKAQLIEEHGAEGRVVMLTGVHQGQLNCASLQCFHNGFDLHKVGASTGDAEDVHAGRLQVEGLRANYCQGRARRETDDKVFTSTALTFGLTVVLMPGVLLLLRRLQLLDQPTDRSSHLQATPRGGGIAPAMAASAALSIASLGVAGDQRSVLVTTAAGFAVIGLLDDFLDVPALPRFMAQALVAAITLPWLLADLQGGFGWQVLFSIGVLLWQIAFVNAFNFMDGINGISAAQALVAGVAWLVIGRVENVEILALGGAIIAAAGLGFAPFNFPRAQLFLGDVGSYFFGEWLAVLVIMGVRADVPPEAVVGPVLLYITDTATTLVRRIRTGETWHKPHRNHIYQQLTRVGWSHGRTTVFVAAIMCATSAVGILALTRHPLLRITAICLMAVLMIGYVRSPQIVESRSA